MAKRTSKIKNMGGIWSKARETTATETGGDFVPVDPGMYLMQLASVEAATFKDRRKVWWKWIVVDADDEQFIGAVCNDFEGIDDEERLVWIQRHLTALGVDLDEVEIEDEDDLVAVYQELIDEDCVARVKVTESSDGVYTNMRVQKRVEADEDILVDPKEALKGGGGKKDKAAPPKSDDGGGDDDDDVELEVGLRVTWEDGERAGEIVGFEDDDTMAVIKEDGKRKKAKVSIDDVTPEDEGDEPEDEDEDGDEDAGDEKEYKYNEDDAVEVEYEGEWYPATVTGAGTESVTIVYDEDETEETVKADRIRVPEGDEEGEDDDGDEDDDEGGDEVEKGDAVLFKVRGRERSGVVASVNKSKGTVRVKDSKGTIHTVDLDEIDFDVE